MFDMHRPIFSYYALVELCLQFKYSSALCAAVNGLIDHTLPEIPLYADDLGALAFHT
ncbi:hypothetical protein GCM10027342_10790 [Photobacterium alginatilyticum]